MKGIKVYRKNHLINEFKGMASVFNSMTDINNGVVYSELAILICIKHTTKEIDALVYNLTNLMLIDALLIRKIELLEDSEQLDFKHIF
jgi:hypothetical protein